MSERKFLYSIFILVGSNNIDYFEEPYQMIKLLTFKESRVINVD